METKLITPMPLSPETTTVGVTAVGATEITVADISAFPDPVDGEEGSALLCAVERFMSDDPADYEAIIYTGRNTGTKKLTGVTRGVEGTARSWPAGTAISCFVLAEHFKRIAAVIGEHEEDAEAHGIAALMPISGGTLENYTEKVVTLTGTATTINLNDGNVFTQTPSGDRTYTISNAVSGKAHSFTFIITMGSTVWALTFPQSVKWAGGEIPDMTTKSKAYVLTFLTINDGSTWFGMFGGEF